MRETIDFSEAPFCAVGKSTICEGQGLFALRDFKKDEIVVDYYQNSKTWEKTEFEKLPISVKETCWWIGEFHQKENVYIALIAKPESLFMRANHNRNPNTNWEVLKRQLSANQKIRAGDEIFFDYRKEIAPIWIKQNPPPWA